MGVYTVTVIIAQISEFYPNADACHSYALGDVHPSTNFVMARA
jgi:hypothetical protein